MTTFDNVSVCINRNVCNVLKGWSLNVTNVDFSMSPYLCSNDDIVLMVDATAGQVEIDLFKCPCYDNPGFIIKKIDSSSNPVLIVPSPGSTINEGLVNYDLLVQDEVVEFVYDDEPNDWRKITDDDRSLLQNKGEFVVFNGLRQIALPPGIDGQLLSADSTAPGGLRYVTGGSGEINTGGNIGSGNGLYAGKVGPQLQFKSIAAGAGISISSSSTTLTISTNPVYEIITTTSIVSPNPAAGFTEIKIVTSSHGTIMDTLADGPSLGFEKVIAISQKSGTDNYSLAVTSFVNGSQLLFEYVGQSARLSWTSLGWMITGGSGVTVL